MGSKGHRIIRGPSAALVSVIALLALGPAAANAADRIYWASNPALTGLGPVHYGNLDGTGDPSMLLAGLPGDVIPGGFALNPVESKLYWAGSTIDYTSIRVANIDGTGAPAEVFGQGLAVLAPVFWHVTVDPIGKKLYWVEGATPFGGGIWTSNLDGSDAHVLYPEVGAKGLALDPAAGMLYWTSPFGVHEQDPELTGHIVKAPADGSGDPVSVYTGEDGASGIALDSNGRLYWTKDANADAGSIRVGSFDGSQEPQTLFPEETGTVTGIAVDQAAQKIYWARSTNGDAIVVGNMDGSGTPTTLLDPGGPPLYPSLLKAPAGTDPPVLSGGGAGRELSCTEGSWAIDVVKSHLYRSPQRFAYEWLHEGEVDPSLSGPEVTVNKNGNWACRVVATNEAGSATQTSDQVEVISNHFEFRKQKRNKRRGYTTLGVYVPGGGVLHLSGKKVRSIGKAPIGAGTVGFRVQARGKARKRLKRRGKLKVKVTVEYTPILGELASKQRKVTLVRKR